MNALRKFFHKGHSTVVLPPSPVVSSRSIASGQWPNEEEQLNPSGPRQGIDVELIVPTTQDSSGENLPSTTQENSGDDLTPTPPVEVGHVGDRQDSVGSDGNGTPGDTTTQSNRCEFQWIQRFKLNPTTLFLVIFSTLALILSAIGVACDDGDDRCQWCSDLKSWAILMSTVVAGLAIVVGVRKNDKTNLNIKNIKRELMETNEENKRTEDKANIERTISRLLNISSNSKFGQQAQDRSWRLACRIWKEYKTVKEGTDKDSWKSSKECEEAVKRGRNFIDEILEDGRCHNESEITHE